MYYVMLFTVRAGDGGGGGIQRQQYERERETETKRDRGRDAVPSSALTAEPIATFFEASPAA